MIRHQTIDKLCTKDACLRTQLNW